MTRYSPPALPGDQAEALCRVGRLFGERQWCLATSGNLSVRVDADHCLITQSGTDKATLAVDDLMLVDLHGKPAGEVARPSAETALHTALYRQNANIGAVLHTHSVTSTVLSRSLATDLVVSGFEMQKAIRGVRSHEESLTIALFDNTQDIDELAAAVVTRVAAGTPAAPGFMVKGHGLYAWGTDIGEAQRHIEGLEFVLACAWQELQR